MKFANGKLLIFTLMAFGCLNPSYSAFAHGTEANMAEVDSTADSTAWQAAERLVESLGGAERWAATKILYVKEKAFPASLKHPVTAEFWRNMERPAYRSVITGPGLRRETQWSEDGGWVIRNGEHTEMTAEALAEEVFYWLQEPYVMYHKLAARDPALHPVLKEGNRLEVYWGDGGRLLCWFDLDASGALLRWGNFYQGEVSEHVYGPIRAVGDFKMPAWGTSTSGSWRFEYIDARSVSNMSE